MKALVSIPDEVHDRVEVFARLTRRSLSDVCSAALIEYVRRHSPDAVTDAMDRVCAEAGKGPDLFLEAASRRLLQSDDW